MKIAHVCPFYTPAIGGVKQVVEELAKRQVTAGHEVHVFTSDWDKEKRIKKKEEIIEGVHVHRCYHIAKIANFATIWPSVFHKLIKGKFDIVHSHVFGHVHFVLAALAAKLSKSKRIHTTHCPWTDALRSSAGRFGVFVSYNIFSRVALEMTDKIIAITPWEKKFIKKYSGKEKKIVILPNGMANLFFKKFKTNNFKKKNGIGTKPLVLFFGRLSPTKAPDHFVLVAKEVLKNHPEARFVVRGPDEGLKSKIKKLIGKEKRILLLEPSRDREEIVKMYKSADIMVLPSFREGLPLTLFEGMAAGLPIIATPVNGIPYEMKEPDNGFLVDYGDIKTMAKKVNELLENKKLREKIGKANIKRSKEYRWDTIAEKTETLYMGALRRNEKFNR